MTGGEGLFQGANQPLYRDFAIEAVGRGGARRTVVTEALERHPFYTLRQFRTDDTGNCARDFLLVPPLSGHFPIFLRDVVLSLLAEFRVTVLDWANVRHVPVAHGVFGFDDNIRAIRDAILRLGPDTAVMALCQGGVPALAAVADLARGAAGAEPAALVLMAAPIDPLANPTAVVRLIRSLPQSWYDAIALSLVPSRYAGRGRRVYPAETQLAGLESYRARRIHENGELSRKFARDDGFDPVHFPFADLYSSVMDLDAKVFTETIGRVFLRRDLARGRLEFDGREIDPGRIRETTLLTVEGAFDDIAAPGQTAAAHELCRALPPARRSRLVVADAGHFSLFHGHIWRETIHPVVRAVAGAPRG